MVRPHVVFLTRSLETGGAEVQLSTLARGLHESGEFEVTIVTFYPGGQLEAGLASSGLRLACAYKRGRWDILPFGVRLTRLLRKLRPQVVHSYLGPPNLLAALLRPLLPAVKVVWSVRASDMDLSRFDWTFRASYFAERMLSRLPDAIVANSRAGRDYAVVSGFPAGRMRIIANGIDTDRFRPERGAAQALRRQWLGSAPGPLVGIVARLDPMKDHPTFLRAAGEFAQQVPGARFVCVGDGPPAYAQRLREVANEHGLADRIVWAGYCDDVPRAWNAMDLATLSSITEGFPNALAEAMACGLPCVTTDVGDARHIVDGAGIVVPRGDARALAEGWHRALTAVTSTPPVAAARERIVANFSVAAMVRATANTYADVLGAA